jgi:acetyl-CoA C-acetyltransferase
VLVGVGVASQRESDPRDAVDTLGLMRSAVECAVLDSGVPEIAARADGYRAPRGFWQHPNPCRLLADHFGARDARTEIAEIGVLQTTLMGRAAQDIAQGRADIVVVVGGETRYRTSLAARQGIELEELEQAATEPDSVLRPKSDIVSAEEIAAGLGGPVTQYALIDNALRASEAQSIPDHVQALGELQAEMSRIAHTNPDAWNREAVDAKTVAVPTAGNRLLAFPYAKLHCSQWNVDQAAALILCAVEVAEQLGVAREKWVFPLAVVDSEYMAPLTTRGELHRSPGFRLAGARALELAGLSIGDVSHLELYSCFPAAVRLQQRELGIPQGRAPSVTGGMTFAGGPLNNFVLQALVSMAHVLRADPGSKGLVTAVSGIVTKQGVSLWSATAPASDFSFEDVSEATAAESRQIEVVAEARGDASIVSYTVMPEGGDRWRSVLLCQLDDGRRVLVSTGDPTIAERGQHQELCGRAVRLLDDGGVEWR